MGIRAVGSIRILRRTAPAVFPNTAIVSAPSRKLPETPSVLDIEDADPNAYRLMNHREKLSGLFPDTQIKTKRLPRYIEKGYSPSNKCDVWRYRRTLLINGEERYLNIESYGDPQDDVSSRFFITLKCPGKKQVRTIASFSIPISYGDTQHLHDREPTTRAGREQLERILCKLFTGVK